MAEPTVRRLGLADLGAYKALRDETLLAHPEAFTSDAAEEMRKEAGDYLQRFGLDRRDGGQFVLGACAGDRLLGAFGCERDLRIKVRHVGHLIGMMVRPEARRRGLGGALLDACIAATRGRGLEMLTLSVSVGNDPAIRLYASRGFTVYGVQPRALCLGAGRYVDKQLMSLAV